MRFLDHTEKHTPCTTPLSSDQLVAEAGTYTTHNARNKQHVHNVIRNRDPGNRATADLRLKITNLTPDGGQREYSSVDFFFILGHFSADSPVFRS